MARWKRSWLLGLQLLLAPATALAAGPGAAGPAAAPFAVRNPYATGLDDTDIYIRTLAVFGDSYSAPHTVVPRNWAERLAFDGEVARLNDLAVIGATAASVPPGTNDLAHQVARWLAAPPVPRGRDLTVVYLGHNDIWHGTDPAGADLAAAMRDYRAGLRRIVGAGAAGGGRRVLLVMPHDWGRDPFFVREGGAGVMRRRTLVWDGFLARTARDLPAADGGVVAVDLFTAMERVFRDPGAFCLTNVTTADKAASATTALFTNDFHVGYRGQDLIGQVVEYYLTRGWDWSGTVKDPGAARRRLRADLDAGRVFTSPCPPASPSR